MNQKFLTVEEIAAVLRVPKSWIYARSRQTGPDEIPRIKVGKYLRFVESDVMEWLARQQDAERGYPEYEDGFLPGYWVLPSFPLVFPSHR